MPIPLRNATHRVAFSHCDTPGPVSTTCRRLRGEEMREELVRSLDAGNLADLRATYSAAMDLHQHLAQSSAAIQFVHDERRVEFNKDRGFGFHGWLYSK